MSIYAILSGNYDSENIADWLNLRKYYFIELLKLENGIPSADTFLRVFRIIEPDKFMNLFSEWIRRILSTQNKIISIDGKAIKSATDKINNGNIPFYETNMFEHGRIENRKYYIVKNIDFINDKDKWENLKSIGLVINQREIKGIKTISYKYYIMDEFLNVKKFADITRSHWHIENKLHWILDVHFKEDLSKSKKDNSIYNLSLLKKICYNLLKLDTSFGNISFKKKLNRYIYDIENINNLIFNIYPQNQTF